MTNKGASSQSNEQLKTLGLMSSITLAKMLIEQQQQNSDLLEENKRLKEHNRAIAEDALEDKKALQQTRGELKEAKSDATRWKTLTLERDGRIEQLQKDLEWQKGDLEYCKKMYDDVYKSRDDIEQRLNKIIGDVRE